MEYLSHFVQADSFIAVVLQVRKYLRNAAVLCVRHFGPAQADRLRIHPVLQQKQQLPKDKLRIERLLRADGVLDLIQQVQHLPLLAGVQRNDLKNAGKERKQPVGLLFENAAQEVFRKIEDDAVAQRYFARERLMRLKLVDPDEVARPDMDELSVVQQIPVAIDLEINFVEVVVMGAAHFKKSVRIRALDAQFGIFQAADEIAFGHRGDLPLVVLRV